MSKKSYTSQENHANQMNANNGTSGVNDAYKARMDNHANQLNPNNPLYQPKGGKNSDR